MARHAALRQPERLRQGRRRCLDCVEPQVPGRGGRVAAELRFGYHSQIRFAKNRAALIEIGAIFGFNLRYERFFVLFTADHRISTRERNRLFLIPGKAPILPHPDKSESILCQEGVEAMNKSRRGHLKSRKNRKFRRKIGNSIMKHLELVTTPLWNCPHTRCRVKRIGLI